jgi:hypothetical protein
MFAPAERQRVYASSTSSRFIDLEGEVLYPNLVITVSAAVGRPDPEHRACARVPQIHNLLGPSVGRVLIARKPSKRAEEIEVEGQRPFDVTDGEINVVYASCGNGAPPVRVRGDPTARPAPAIWVQSRVRTTSGRTASVALSSALVSRAKRERTGRSGSQSPVRSVAVAPC